MDTRMFTGKEAVSLLGFGMMRLPKAEEGKNNIAYKEAAELVDLAWRQGVNYFDTAWFYHDGDSEVFTGQALQRYPRGSYYLTTKMPVSLLETEEDIPRFFEEQFKRTGAEYFDFYLCHALSAKSFQKMEALGLYPYLEKQKAAGRIRHIGFSFHDTPETLETICAAHPWEFAQIQLNYLDWELYRSREQYEILRRYNLPVIVMEPVRGGRLADLGPEANAMLEQAAPGRSIASWAFRYAAALPGVMTVLSGMSTRAQVEDNLQTFSPLQPLSAGETAALEQAGNIYRSRATIPCTGCRYCVPCPLGVEIPELFSLYNDNAFSGSMEAFNKQYAGLAAEGNAAACIDCGKCAAVCPQQIAIPELLRRLHSGEAPV